MFFCSCVNMIKFCYLYRLYDNNLVKMLHTIYLQVLILEDTFICFHVYNIICYFVNIYI